MLGENSQEQGGLKNL